MTQHTLKIVLIMLTALLMVSCRKTNYGTSLAMQNHLDVEIEIEVFPIESPYSLMTRFSIPSGNEVAFYNTGVTDESAWALLSATFDSIKVHVEGIKGIIVFTTDAVVGYSANPYTDTEIWQSRTLEYEIYDMSKHEHEDLNHYFGIEPELLLEEK
ncbi:MAG: hypothetical protein V2B15_09625 [Bacteroidota bacterium]